MMKFDVVVGNPPYHYEKGRRKIPIYQHFMTGAAKLGKYVCLVTPDGFLKGGQQLDPVRNWLIESKNLKTIDIYKYPVFNGVAVQAAISVFDTTQKFTTPIITVHGPSGESATSDWTWEHTDADMDKSKIATRKIYENIISNAETWLGTVGALPGKNRQGAVGGAQTGTMQDVIPGRAPFGLNTKAYKSNKDNFSLSLSRANYQNTCGRRWRRLLLYKP
jgi:hypothetical protein